MDEIMKAMNELSEEISKAKTARIWNNAMRFAFEPVKETAEQIIKGITGGSETSTGTLAKSLYIKTHRPTARDKQSRTYAGEQYMARVSITAKRDESEEAISVYKTKKGKLVTKKYIKFRGSNRPVAMAVEFGTLRRASRLEFGSAKLGPRPFMRTALEQNIIRVQERLAGALWRELMYGKYTKEAGKDFTGRI